MRNETLEKIRQNMNWVGAKKLAARVFGPLQDIAADARLRKTSAKKRDSNRPIRVAFLLQMPEIWDKLEPVYDEMSVDQRFEPILVAIPDPSTKRWDDVPISKLSRKSEQFCTLRYNERKTIFALRSDKVLEDISSCGFEYVFYQRPYDEKLPKQYRSSVVSRWAQVCYIPYGYILAPVYERMETKNKAFFRNVSIAFHESEHMRDTMNKVWESWHGPRLRFHESLGYPALSRFSNMNRRSVIKRILWTPRWSTDPVIGGSHFLEYKESFIDFASKGCQLRLRPHPLLFDELERRALLTKAQIDEYRSRLITAGCTISTTSDCVDDFAWSDVIITDFSSIVVQYYLTGKPIVYCPPEYKVSDLMIHLMEGMYVANSWEDVVSNIEMLISGEDPKRSLRESISKEVFGDTTNAASRINDYLYNNHINNSSIYSHSESQQQE